MLDRRVTGDGGASTTTSFARSAISVAARSDAAFVARASSTSLGFGILKQPLFDGLSR
jgi:hypothetical protein